MALEIAFELTYIMGGVVGSILKIVLEQDGKFIIPKAYNTTIDGIERKVLSLGFLGSVLVGVFVAMVADHSFLVSVLASMMGSWTLERAYDIQNRIRKGELVFWK